MTHWKKLTNPDYLGAYSLDDGKDKTVQIKSVSKKLVPNSTGDKEECIVAELVGEKPLILNKTNCKTIAKTHNTPHIEEWAGKKITLYVAKVRAFGETVDAIRIRPTVPELPELTPKHPKWEDAKKAIKAGQVTIGQIKSNYKINQENEKQLTAV